MELGYYGADRDERLARERIHARWLEAYAPSRHLDLLLVVSVLALSALGVVMVYSATNYRLQLQDLSPGLFATKQIIHLIVALAGMVVAAVIDYHYARAYAPLIYLGAVLLLVVVLTPLGTEVRGTQGWIALGAFQLQPAELTKVALVLAIAALLHERRAEPNLATIGAVLGIVGIPALLILAQPDFGTFLIFPWLAFMLLLVGGTRGRYLVGLAMLAVPVVVAVFQLGLLESYQVARLTAFLDPDNAALAQTAAYNANQSMIAIGSGGLVGKGFLQGTQTNLSYVPENHTDFVFTVVGEEFGFLGATLVLGLFAVVLWRGLRIAALAKDLFGTLVASGAVAIFTLQLFVNVGMTLGISPVTGIPLPFVSYGGTSLLSAYLLVGLLLNVHMRRF